MVFVRSYKNAPDNLSPLKKKFLCLQKKLPLLTIKEFNKNFIKINQEIPLNSQHKKKKPKRYYHNTIIFVEKYYQRHTVCETQSIPMLLNCCCCVYTSICYLKSYLM